ncbi:MAG TPA: beta-ketoacyl synthase N-terminal-like domain-containing protein [Isosphaeraceae bacterium]|nr:beta-ketoacyl synthase N-terminal-like domain-containing protein [Isosphaeraceae bacterium]
MTERILVVGCSALSCLGKDLDSTWDGLIAGRSGLRRLESLCTKSFLQVVGGVVENFGPGTDFVDPAVEKLPVRSIHLALAAARDVLRDAGLHPEMDHDPHRAAVVVGSSMGGMDLIHAEQKRMLERGVAGSDRVFS